MVKATLSTIQKRQPPPKHPLLLPPPPNTIIPDSSLRGFRFRSFWLFVLLMALFPVFARRVLFIVLWANEGEGPGVLDPDPSAVTLAAP